jgi:hypothetical protein
MEELTQLAGQATSPISVLAVAVIFGFVPAAVLKMLVQLYPVDDPRRTELMGELYAQPYRYRLLFTAAMIPTVVVDAPVARRRARQARRDAAGMERAQ